jgi:CRP-like cAMP-binding protein
MPRRRHFRSSRESDAVYLVLSGEFRTFQNGKLLVKYDHPAVAPPGTVLGEISALRGCLPTATVVGDGVVLRIAREEFLRQLDINPVFRESVEELAKIRLGLDRLRRK